MSDLEERLERERREKEWAETWEPEEPGDALIGTLEKVEEAPTEFGTYEVAHIRNEDGVLKGLWLMHTVLQNEWTEADPQPGDRIGALYHGQRAGQDYDYHMWSVEVERAGETSEDRPPQRPDEGETLDGKEKAERLYGDEEADDRPDPTMDDPHADLPY